MPPSVDLRVIVVRPPRGAVALVEDFLVGLVQGASDRRGVPGGGADCVNGPPEPMAIKSFSCSISSPLPVSSSEAVASATISLSLIHL